MTTDSYNPQTSLSPYYRSRAANRADARLWSTEKALHDLAALGVLAFFEGPGPDPSQLSGFSSTKYWLKQSPGVQAQPGIILYWNEQGSANDEANWDPITPEVVQLRLTAATSAIAAAATATTAAGQASASATAAATAASAISAAVASAGIYPDTTAGLAAVSNLAYFWVPSASAPVPTLILYQEVSGAAVEILQMPAAAAAVDLLHFAKSRYDTEIFDGRRAEGQNRLATTDWNLRTAVRNSDNTITIPPGDYIQYRTISPFEDAELANTALTWTLYVVAARAIVSTALRIRVQRDAFTEVASPSISRPVPGVVKYQFLNNNGGSSYSDFRIFVWNDSSDPVAIYWPELYLHDGPYLPQIKDLGAVVAVGTQPVRNYPDWWRGWASDRPQRHLSEKQVTSALDSVDGLSGNAGTLYAPKQLVAHLPSQGQGAVVGLYRGSVWRERLAITSTVRGVCVIDVADGATGDKDLPVLSAMDEVVNGDWTDNADGTYSYTWTAASTVDADTYENVYVVEVDTNAEADRPVSSRVRMSAAASSAAARAQAGSCYIESLGSNQWRATMRPSDDAAPGTRYRYEVVARFNCVDWVDYARDGMLSGVKLIGQSHGYGCLAGPKRFVGDRLVLLHASTHTAVIGGGTIQRSVIYGTGDDDCILLTFYTADGTGQSWRLAESFIYGGSQAFLCHTSGFFYDAGEIDRVVVNGGRNSRGVLPTIGIETGSLSALKLRDVFVDGFAIAYRPNQGASADCQNSVFRRCARIEVAAGLFRNNIAHLENWGDPDSINNRGARLVITDNGVVERNIFYFKYNPDVPLLNSDRDCVLYGSNPVGVIRQNIFVVDFPGTQNIVSASAFPVTYTADRNVIVLVGNVATFAGLPSPAFQVSDFEVFQFYTGQDADSLLIDLRGDPRGARAVFADPDNGDFRWAQTETAQRIAAYCQENEVGPEAVISQWPQIPTVDEAAQLIQSA